jgi:hypothetical protein
MYDAKQRQNQRKREEIYFERHGIDAGKYAASSIRNNKEQQSAKDSMRSREIDWNCRISQATKTETKGTRQAR